MEDVPVHSRLRLTFAVPENRILHRSACTRRATTRYPRAAESPALDAPPSVPDPQLPRPEAEPRPTIIVIIAKPPADEVRGTVQRPAYCGAAFGSCLAARIEDSEADRTRLGAWLVGRHGQIRGLVLEIGDGPGKIVNRLARAAAQLEPLPTLGHTVLQAQDLGGYTMGEAGEDKEMESGDLHVGGALYGPFVVSPRFRLVVRGWRLRGYAIHNPDGPGQWNAGLRYSSTLTSRSSRINLKPSAAVPCHSASHGLFIPPQDLPGRHVPLTDHRFSTARFNSRPIQLPQTTGSKSPQGASSIQSADPFFVKQVHEAPCLRVIQYRSPLSSFRTS
jgi:hypothetical protein